MKAFVATAILFLGCSRCFAGEPEGMILVTANINEAIMPVARGQKYGDPLSSFLAERGIGEVTGAGTTLGPDGEPNWVDVTFDLRDPETNAPAVARALKDLGAPAGSFLRYWIGAQKHEVAVPH